MSHWVNMHTLFFVPLLLQHGLNCGIAVSQLDANSAENDSRVRVIFLIQYTLCSLPAFRVSEAKKRTWQSVRQVPIKTLLRCLERIVFSCFTFVLLVLHRTGLRP